MSSFVVQRNGREATAAELAPLAFAGFAHMTAMQVRDGGVRGLDLHLERLRNASLTMFGQALPDERVRDHLRTAIERSPADHSLLATVYSNAGEFTAADGTLDVLVRTSPAASGPTGPLSLMTVEHERALPELKHVGEVAKTHYLRRAVAQGFDDAAFLDRRGRFSEASIWNLAFWDGEAVVWPEADMLGGTMMGTVRRQLEGLGVPQRTEEIRPADLPELAGAVVMNSWTPGIAVHRIDATDVPAAPEFLELLHRAHRAEPLVAP
ncbi:Branched-chain amino acid aminotransferase/4-amino-4-deoxychorismate lyase [Saccharopolyspora kobensis]|uniref:Branched-chain amino acid aminotransferase/4-amino-4-deoxychorismate lyase n=1 Tax=Saccharopolyspora kobensis TaxID=146035 RepID=A0A1H6ED43_9PSEU|nr:aminotransferase class IV family protein [Saccharopolyspora kobensis]SEG94725.1 Branched-chain amino acid aminotransferase/4-amino-4-deoxychorismate lyase [Saccharopolyspora kobensis]SFD63245.1 Branched-chain amino acid aminotransferase/4-amino-4-deoxychorismate lyase [Saccharopolyspora kobensis]